MYDAGVIVTMDYQVLFNIVLGAAAFMGGYILNGITHNLREANKRITSVEGRVQDTRETYVTKLEHGAEAQAIAHRFDRIDDKLDAIRDAVASKA